MKPMNRTSWIKLALMLALAVMLAATAACGNAKQADNGSNTSANAQNGNAASSDAGGSDNGTAATNASGASNAGAGNSGTSGVQESPAATDAASGTESAPQATEYPLTVKDETGTELTFDQAPQRIVTLVPSETEIVYAVGAGDQVVAVDDYSNYPEEAASKEKIGGMDANIEKIVGLKPDLVLASSSMSDQTIAQLRNLKLNVYATDPKTYDAVIDKITQIGVILDKAAQAAEVTGHMQQVRDQVVAAVKDAPKPKAYLEFSPGWTVGKGEFLDELLTLAGGTNVADQPGYYQIDPETIVKANPDVIIYASITVKEGEKNPILDAIEQRPGWNAIAAIKNKQLFEVDQDPLVRVGPRLAEGLLEVAKKLHPDLIQ